MFLVECPGGRRTREVLEKIIVDHVQPGSTIYTDGWKAYHHLGDLGNCQSHFDHIFFLICLGYDWKFVNHDRCYVDPETGVHTNRIESR